MRKCSLRDNEVISHDKTKTYNKDQI